MKRYEEQCRYCKNFYKKSFLESGFSHYCKENKDLYKKNKCNKFTKRMGNWKNF